MTLTDAIKAGHSAKTVGKAIEIRTQCGKLMGRLWYPRPSTAQQALRIAINFCNREAAQ